MTKKMMQSLVLSKGRLQFKEIEVPTLSVGEVLLKVIKAGICQTDIELTKGYMDFNGVIGHEFVGRVVESGRKDLLGKRVVAEINCACGECASCIRGNKNHCLHRTVLGILNKPGIFSEYAALPMENLHIVPESISDTAAVFIEPLAAALRIPQQIRVEDKERVLVMGDGKLGLLVAQVMKLHSKFVWCSGRHKRNLSLLKGKGIQIWDEKDEGGSQNFNLIVDATGNPESLAQALQRLSPQGRLVLKSTYHGDHGLDISKIVVDEFHIIGSRCGPFSDAIEILKHKTIDVEELVDGDYPLSCGIEAFSFAKKPGVIKVLITP